MSAEFSNFTGVLKKPLDAKFPAVSEYELKVFAIFARNYERGFWPNSIRLEGDGRLPVVAAGLRLEKKGIVTRHSSCHWYLTELGREMALDWHKKTGWKPRKR